MDIFEHDFTAGGDGLSSDNETSSFDATNESSSSTLTSNQSSMGTNSSIWSSSPDNTANNTTSSTHVVNDGSTPAVVVIESGAGAAGVTEAAAASSGVSSSSSISLRGHCYSCNRRTFINRQTIRCLECNGEFVEFTPLNSASGSSAAASVTGSAAAAASNLDFRSSRNVRGNVQAASESANAPMFRTLVSSYWDLMDPPPIRVFAQ